MNTNLKLGKTYKINYPDGHFIIAKFMGGNPPVFEVDGKLINVNELLKGHTSIEEL